jgi:hypothetical protein
VAGNRLAIRFALLWLAISGVRSLYAYVSLQGIAQWVQAAAFLIFVVAIPIVQLLIFKRAAEDYRGYTIPRHKWDSVFYSPKDIPSKIRLGKFLIALFMFLLVFGLWTTRDNKQALVPIIVGSAFNLLFVAVWARTMFRMKLRQQNRYR